MWYFDFLSTFSASSVINKIHWCVHGSTAFVHSARRAMITRYNRPNFDHMHATVRQWSTRYSSKIGIFFIPHVHLTPALILILSRRGVQQRRRRCSWKGDGVFHIVLLHPCILLTHLYSYHYHSHYCDTFYKKNTAWIRRCKRRQVLRQLLHVVLIVTCVYIGVLFHVWLLVKAFVTERTGVRADVGVYHEMSG